VIKEVFVNLGPLTFGIMILKITKLLGNWWNTENCFAPGMNAEAVHNITNHTTTPVEEFWE